jgi:hypothetical protein
MPKAHFRDNAMRHYRDQEGDLSEILQRLDRLEQAVMILAGTNGNGGAQGDEQDPGVGAESYQGSKRIGYTIKTDRDGQSRRLFGSDDMVTRGNLSVVDPKAHDFGKVYQVRPWDQ